MTTKPHDALFKTCFTPVENARQLMERILPPTVRRALAWNTLSPEPSSFIVPSLGDRHGDLLFSAQLNPVWGLPEGIVYLLLEHQSTFDGRMPLRGLEYVTLISRRHTDAHPGSLPMVLPMLVTHVPGGWAGPTSFQDLVVPTPGLIPGVSPFVPHFSLLVDDLAHLSNQALRNRALSPFPTLALWALRDGRDPEALLGNFEYWSGMFRQALQSPNGLESVGQLLRYFYLIIPQSQHRRFRATMLQYIPEVETVERTIGEALIEQGILQGREQGLLRGLLQGREQGLSQGLVRGRKQGREQGLSQGRQQTLLRQLELKFGPLPPDYAALLQSASSEQLDVYTERVLFAPSLAAVFEPTR